MSTNGLPANKGHVHHIRLNPKDELSILDICEKLEVPNIHRQSFSQLVKIALETLITVARRDRIIPEPDTFQYSNRVLNVYYNDTGSISAIRADRLAHSTNWLIDQATYQAADREQIVPPQDMTTLTPEQQTENTVLQREFKDLYVKVKNKVVMSDEDIARYVDLQLVGQERNWNMDQLTRDALKP